jgi:three-Cys-motif partner protein
MSNPLSGMIIDDGEYKANNLGVETYTPELQHLKRVSRIKHEILTNYLPPWAVILGSRFGLLYYVDCFAGPGQFESEGMVVDGSPVIAVKAGKTFAQTQPGKNLGIVLLEEDEEQLERLKVCLAATLPYPKNFQVKTTWPIRTSRFRRLFLQSGSVNRLRVFSWLIHMDTPYLSLR